MIDDISMRPEGDDAHEILRDRVEDAATKKTIPLMEMFGPTVQGEGTVIGQQTYFLRFGLCDYRCRMCDSLHAVLPQLVKRDGIRLTQQEIFERFWEFRKTNSTDWVTFSGGNPAMHDLTNLLALLQDNHLKVNVETQGTIYHPWLSHVDSLTISPKGPGMGENHVQSTFLAFLNAVFDGIPGLFGPTICIKIVIFDQRDLDFAAEIFESIKGHPLFRDIDLSNVFYLSLGNPNPPNPADENAEQFDPGNQIQQYRTIHEDIKFHPVLSKVRWLPQWHAFVWGNLKGV